MKINIISAYLSHTLEVVAIALDCYYILNADLDEDKSRDIVIKINSIREIDDIYWTKKGN